MQTRVLRRSTNDTTTLRKRPKPLELGVSASERSLRLTKVFEAAQGQIA